jgi:dTDP-glucose pyrophosphorylase
MNNWQQYLIAETATIKEALAQINQIGDPECVLFVTGSNRVLLGALTDGDIRRGLIDNIQLNEPVLQVTNKKCARIVNGEMSFEYLQQCRQKNIFSLPNLDGQDVIVSIINLREYKTTIPIDAVIMAGGRGERLLPLTKATPKPMLPVGDKPIIEHNIDSLVKFGVQHIQISVNYLASQISDHFGNGSDKGISIQYIHEDKPLGTIGSLTLAAPFQHEVVLLMNSDLLTNVDFADFYSEFIKSGADMAVATIPHHVDLPYAILDLQDNIVTSLKEKPRYTYFANAGIYLIKTGLLSAMPRGEFYNATDLMEKVIAENKKLIHFPILGYWLDIGKHQDYTKAQNDIQHLKL